MAKDAGWWNKFLSTPSARRATQEWQLLAQNDRKFLSTPSARRATDQVHRGELAGSISIHALREEGDQISSAAPKAVSQFLSTPSARRATWSCGRRSVKHRRFLSTPSARRATAA